MRILNVDSLPPLPYLAHEILLAVNDEDSDIPAVGAKLDKEPGVTARVIAMANSAFFGNQRPVYSVEEAVIRLGLNRVRVVAASLLLAQQFDSSQCAAFRAERYWHDAVATAFACGRLASATDGVEPDAAYLCGLLHNIGLPLLVHVFPTEMETVLARHEADPDRPLARLCRQAVGSDHHTAGRMLLIEWGLPAPAGEVAGSMGEDRPDGPHGVLTRCVQFCAEWASGGFEGIPSAEGLPEVTDRVLQRTAEACRQEEEQMAAFARLLASA